LKANKIINEKQVKKFAPKTIGGKFFLFSMLALVFTTVAIYYKSLNNDFTNWDDPTYITSNPDIRTLHGDSISYTFNKIFKSYVSGNYHPFTMLSYSIEYSMFKLNSKPYHVTNLILHILNAILVFYFIWLLTKQKWSAFITALLFAIHPMHVESVAWVSERKDVLYAFFSLAALCFYVKFSFARNRKWIFYSISLLLYIFAILSKAMAVCIPVVFILIDFFRGRRITLKRILEKIPFLLISIVFGIIAIIAQKSVNAIQDNTYHNFFERIMFGSYGTLVYLWKLFIPCNLSCYYSYPIKHNGIYPGIFYVAPFAVIALFFIVYRSLRKGKVIIFGFGFFLITVALVLQIIAVGGTIISERYTYIQYIGLFFIIAHFINKFIENKTVKLQPYKIPLITALIAITIMYSYISFQRTKIWVDSIALWTDAINKYDKEPTSYDLRGNAFYRKEQYDNAISDFTKYIYLKNDKAHVYYDRGLCYIELKKYNEAINDFNSAIRYKPNYAFAYYNKGIVYNDLGEFEEAIKCYNNAIKYFPDYSNAYYNRAGAYYITHQYQYALADALKSQQLGYAVDPSFIEAIKSGFNRKDGK